MNYNSIDLTNETQTPTTTTLHTRSRSRLYATLFAAGALMCGSAAYFNHASPAQVQVKQGIEVEPMAFAQTFANTASSFLSSASTKKLSNLKKSTSTQRRYTNTYTSPTTTTAEYRSGYGFQRRSEESGEERGGTPVASWGVLWGGPAAASLSACHPRSQVFQLS